MPFRLLSLILLLLASLHAQAADDTTTITLEDGSYDLSVTFLAPTIVRITKTPVNEPISHSSMSVVIEPQEVSITRKTKDGKRILASKQLSISVDTATGLLTFALPHGEILLQEQQFSLSQRTTGADKGAYEVSQTFTLDANEPIYGLGILQDGQMNRRGTHRYMIQRNQEDYQNVIQSLKGWALFWDNYSPTYFDDDSLGMTFRSEVGDGIDYYFLLGKNTDGCVSQLRELTGQVPMPPLWTFGFWQSKERYKSMQETYEVVSTYRHLGIPIDGIVQDWQYWGSNYLWNAMDFLGDGFQDAEQWIDSIHAANAHLMITIWSSFGPHTKGYAQMDSAGHLMNFRTWPSSGSSHWPPRLDYPSGVRCYDPFASSARDIYWNNLKPLWLKGIDAWWMDSTEPDNEDFGEEDFDRLVGDDHSAGLSMRRLRNAYPLATTGGVYNHQRALSSDQRVFIMTRSGFAGQQRYAAGVWSGDITASWQTLRAQLPAGLNFSLTGNPSFNSDIGGFFAGSYDRTWGDGSAPRNPAYQELYVRWMQYGLCCPIFRSHGTEVPREIWLYGQAGEPVYDALVEAIKLRYTLIPYLYALAWQVTHNADSYLRPLVSDFASDPRTHDLGQEFMLGHNLLCAPITQAQYTSEDERFCEQPVDFTVPRQTTVYLPAGTVWYDLHTGQHYSGGQDLTLTTTLASIPLFAREGSIIPRCESMQHTPEKAAWTTLQLCIYPGSDAAFTLYEDEGDNYNYEQGTYSEIPITWNDRSRTLTIDNVDGLPIDEPHNITAQLPNGTTRTLTYQGKKVSVKF